MELGIVLILKSKSLLLSALKRVTLAVKQVAHLKMERNLLKRKHLGPLHYPESSKRPIPTGDSLTVSSNLMRQLVLVS
jgi:hypothetical protein